MTDLEKLIEVLRTGDVVRIFSLTHALFPDDYTRRYILMAADGSMDAAKNVFDELLPDWMWSIEAYDRAEVWPSLQPENVTFAQDEGGNHARMWLLATLKAYAAIKESEG